MWEDKRKNEILELERRTEEIREIERREAEQRERERFIVNHSFYVH